MSQVAAANVGPMTVDPYEVGWYLESADEDTYGPISLKTLRGFLQEKTITPNTLVRHCTQPEAKPAADQRIVMNGLDLDLTRSTIGDKLSESWPRKKRDRQALAEDKLPCAWHNRPATLVCVRCHAPYCNKCRAKPFRKQFFLCRRCQSRMYNYRVVAMIVDSLILVYLPLVATALILEALGMDDPGVGLLIIYAVNFVAALLFVLRDSLFRGAGPGKRLAGLRVVQTRNGQTPPTKGQAILRWLSQLIPFFNLVDLSVPYRDPLMRRYGDRWASTRVIDSVKKLDKARAKISRRLIKKGLQPPPEVGLTMEGLARIE